MTHSAERVAVLGAGLAGSEAAWQLARRRVPVKLVEMRPAQMGPAHHTASFAELVCSNSFKSDDPSTASGLLKRELELLGSVVLACARATALPAGAALAVDRSLFAELVTQTILSEPLIEVDLSEARTLPPGQVIVATGPLTSTTLAEELATRLGVEHLAFYDAAAPIIEASTIDTQIAFRASRYGKGEGADYLNLPLTRDQYKIFVEELIGARRVTLRDFETADLFQACQPIEEIARRGPDALRFGALKPVGLTDPHTGERPWAVVQLRSETRSATAYNLVGFQTNLTFGEQKRVFGNLPGLQDAEFLRYGVMHRNTFLDAPRLLDQGMALRGDPQVHIAGQLSGTEGYLEAAATGLLAALDTYARIRGLAPVMLPATSALGSLVVYATSPDTHDYQPMHVNFGLMPPLDPPVRRRAERRAAQGHRALADTERYILERPELGIPVPVAVALGEVGDGA